MECSNRNFVKTAELLKELELTLSCKLCGNVFDNAKTNTLCCHTFCGNCAQSLKTQNCPLCFVPVTNESLQDDYQFSTLVSLMSKFNEALTDQKVNLDSLIIGENSILEENKNNNQKDFKQQNNKTELKIMDNKYTEERKTPLSKQKKNAKGETPLHIASIRGNENAVINLLQDGYNPNIKDNAGWTPLHEASNHGFANIVEMLLQHGAVVNMTGWENSTPLHDAVINNHCKVAEILLKYGADVGARNQRGETPLKLSFTPEMKRILELHSKNKIVPLIENYQAKYDKICLMVTGLSSDQKHIVEKCAKLLNFTIAKDYSDNVTHLVAACNSKKHCPRTLKFLQGILCGCWIVDFCWIQKCIENQSKVSEEEFEVIGAGNQVESYGPKKARLNAEKQYPPLFDGCQFYISGNFPAPLPSNEQFCALVKLGGGKLLSREPRLELSNSELIVPYHAELENSLSKCTYFIISSNPTISITDRICRLPADWLLDSIGAFSLLDPV